MTSFNKGRMVLAVHSYLPLENLISSVVTDIYLCIYNYTCIYNNIYEYILQILCELKTKSKVANVL